MIIIYTLSFPCSIVYATIKPEVTSFIQEKIKKIMTKSIPSPSAIISTNRKVLFYQKSKSITIGSFLSQTI